jgi:hypothetical protein
LQVLELVVHATVMLLSSATEPRREPAQSREQTGFADSIGRKGVESPDDQPDRKAPQMVRDREEALTDLRPQAADNVCTGPALGFRAEPPTH